MLKHADTAAAGASAPLDVGTLWTLQRNERPARCVLYQHGTGWEVRVTIDDVALLQERCRGTDEVLALAENWRERLRQAGWTDGRQRVLLKLKPDRRRPPSVPGGPAANPKS